MTHQSVCASVTGWHSVPETQTRINAGIRRLLQNFQTTSVPLRSIASVLLMSASSLAFAQQTIVVDINVVGLNVNQTQATLQLDQACATLEGDGTGLQEVCDLIDTLDPNDADDVVRLREIADAVAPEEVFVMNDSLIALADYQTTNVHARLNALRQRLVIGTENNDEELGLLSDGFNLASAPSSGSGASGDLVSRIGGFVNGHVSSGDFDGEQLQQDTDISSSSLTLGGDYRFNDNVVAGLGLGLLRDDASFTRILGGSDSTGVNVTAFATWYEASEGYVDIVLDIGSIDYELERSVSTSPNTTLIASSSPSASATTVTVSGGRNFKPFGWDLGGYLRLSLTRANIDGYSESRKTQDPGFAALFSVNAQKLASTKMTVGFELSKAISTSRAVVLPLLRIEYVKENEKKKDDVLATLISTGTVAKYEGEDRVAGYSNLGIGASAVFSGGKSVYAYYETHLLHDLISQNWLKAGLRLEF